MFPTSFQVEIESRLRRLQPVEPQINLDTDMLSDIDEVIRYENELGIKKKSQNSGMSTFPRDFAYACIICNST